MASTPPVNFRTSTLEPTRSLACRAGSVEAGVGLFAFPQKLDDRQTVWKIDHHFSDRDILSFRYGYENQVTPKFTVNFPGFQTSSYNKYHAAVLTGDSRFFSGPDE